MTQILDAIKISSVLGNGQRLDGGAMFGNVPRALWQKWATPDQEGRIELACRAMLVEIDDRKILCETGIGAFFEPKLRDRFGVSGEGHVLLHGLQELGLKPEQITDIVLSHLHFDHAGGMLTAFEEGEPRLQFPNAKVFVGEEAWKRCQNPHSRDRASFIPVLTQLLSHSSNLRVVEGSAKGHAELPQAFGFFYSEGHTPGQMHVRVQGSSQNIIFAGDLIPGTSWVHLPITMGYDRFPERLIDEKTALYESLSTEKDWIFYTHDPSVSASKIHRPEKKWEPLEPMASLKQMEI